MNTQSKIKAQPIEAICVALTKGDFSLLPEGDYTRYTAREWMHEAQAALDSECFDEIIPMIAQGIAQVTFDNSGFGGDLWSDGPDFVEWFKQDAPFWLSLAHERVAPIGGAS